MSGAGSVSGPADADPSATCGEKFNWYSRIHRPRWIHASRSNRSSTSRCGPSGSATAQRRRLRVAELLDQVGLAGSFATRKPRELSGGQQQRVAIARALAPRSPIVVLDEALSALDVVTQRRILDLLQEVQRDLSLTYLFISHDLDVVRSISDHVAVLRRGRVVETGPTGRIFGAPAQDYTRALLDATPGRRLRSQLATLSRRVS